MTFIQCLVVLLLLLLLGYQYVTRCRYASKVYGTGPTLLQSMDFLIAAYFKKSSKLIYVCNNVSLCFKFEFCQRTKIENKETY